MTGRTHDLAAFTALVVAVSFLPLPQLSLATVFAAVLAGMLGGLLPDIDSESSDFWDTLPVGEILSQIIRPLIGAHRHISHSLLGLVGIGYLSQYLMSLAAKVILVNINIVWWAFMVGYISHLLSDMVTREGLPLFFPFNFNFGLPPARGLRIKTGGKIEKLLVFPGLLALTVYSPSRKTQGC